jgi:hypothetical protein
LLGAKEKRDIVLTRLADHAQRDAQVKEAVESGVKALSAFQDLLAQRQVFAASIAELESVEPTAVAASFGALFAPQQPTPWRQGTLRWLYRELETRPSEDQRRGAALFHQVLNGEASDGPLWSGLPSKFREGYLARLKSLEARDEPTATTEGAPGGEAK